MINDCLLAFRAKLVEELAQGVLEAKDDKDADG